MLIGGPTDFSVMMGHGGQPGEVLLVWTWVSGKP